VAQQRQALQRLLVAVMLIVVMLVMVATVLVLLAMTRVIWGTATVEAAAAVERLSAPL
jgi:ABC-type cobalt transport system substrate-binding protein